MLLLCSLLLSIFNSLLCWLLSYTCNVLALVVVQVLSRIKWTTLEREYVQRGSVSLARQLTYHKLQELDLSPRKDLEHLPICRGVTTLDVEENEGR